MRDTDRDEELAQRIQDGTRESFEALLDAYERRVYNLALRMLGNPADAEDAVQETFIQVHRSLRSFRAESRLDTWIYRIAVNVCLQRRRKLALPSVELPDAEHLAAPDADPFRAAAHSELGAKVSAALDRLPAEQRDVALLHSMEGLTYAEVAQVLGCPVGTVKSRLSAAFGRLRKLLGGYVESAGYVNAAVEESVR